MGSALHIAILVAMVWGIGQLLLIILDDAP
jgi:hypothetical protein